MQEQLLNNSATQHLLLRCVGLRLSPNPTYGLRHILSGGIILNLGLIFSLEKWLRCL